MIHEISLESAVPKGPAAHRRPKWGDKYHDEELSAAKHHCQIPVEGPGHEQAAGRAHVDCRTKPLSLSKAHLVLRPTMLPFSGEQPRERSDLGPDSRRDLSIALGRAGCVRIEPTNELLMNNRPPLGGPPCEPGCHPRPFPSWIRLTIRAFSWERERERSDRRVRQLQRRVWVDRSAFGAPAGSGDSGVGHAPAGYEPATRNT